LKLPNIFGEGSKKSRNTSNQGSQETNYNQKASKHHEMLDMLHYAEVSAKQSCISATEHQLLELATVRVRPEHHQQEPHAHQHHANTQHALHTTNMTQQQWQPRQAPCTSIYNDVHGSQTLTFTWGFSWRKLKFKVVSTPWIQVMQLMQHSLSTSYTQMNH